MSLAAAVGLSAAGPGAPATAVGDTTGRVSVSSTGAQGNGGTFGPPVISSDGRYVAFTSSASNLVPGDTNGFIDVFVRDRKLGTTSRVSLSSTETQGNAHSGIIGRLAISSDGRYVAFDSFASNLVPGDTNAAHDVFVRDRKLGTTRRVSVSSTGAQGNDQSNDPAISSAGRYVSFTSYASNLVPGDTNAAHDVFVRDRKLGTTRRVSLSSTGAHGNSGGFGPSVISSAGGYVAFSSGASLVAGDTNGSVDVFVRDRERGTTRRVSVSSTGAQSNDQSNAPAISSDGRYVAFTSFASNLVPGDTNAAEDVFVRDRKLGTTRQVSVSSPGAQGNSGSFGPPVISPDGRYVAFDSAASNLVPGDTNGWIDVFVRDWELGTTRRVSVSSTEAQGNRISSSPAISSAGRYVAFSSGASNLVPGDTNGSFDVFVRIRGAAP